MDDRSDNRGQLLAELDELRAGERFYRSCFDRAPYAIFVVDATGRFVDANPAACRRLGYARAELLELALVDITASDDRAWFGTLQREESASAEVVLRREDGATFLARIEAVRLVPERFMAFVTDITQLREHEEALRRERDRAESYLDTVEAIIVALDADGCVTRLNRKGCRILGYREEELRGKSWFQTCLPQPEGTDEVLPYFHRLMAGELEPLEYFENPIVTREGERRDIRWHNALLRDDRGAIIGTLSAGEDITERKRLERELQQTQKLEALGRLAGGVAHDMNNILAIVIGLASLGESELSAEHPVRDHLRDIGEAASRGKSLVANMLGFARRGNYDKRLLSVDDIVRRLVIVLGQSLSKKTVVETDLAPDLGGIRGDEAQISQTIMNLCINAADAVNGDGTITLATRNQEVAADQIPGLVAGRYVRIDVCDDGPGMSDEVRAKAFEPFFTTKEPGKGTGLGLSMAYGIVTNHHGAVELDSAPGRGTRVTLWFPLVEDASEEQPESRPRPRREDHEARRATVLVVDDELLLRRIICRILERWGYDTLSASDGREAIELYRDRHEDIDLVLLDLSMPGMDGKDCFAELQALDRQVRVLLCTGHGEEATTDELRRRGAVAIARKPFSPEALVRLVEDALRSTPAPRA